MRYLFRELPSACDNTLWVAERCEVEIEFGKPQLPNFPLPPGFETDDDYLRHLVFEGAHKRWGAVLADKVTDRLLFELKVIGDMGFSSYFLITRSEEHTSELQSLMLISYAVFCLNKKKNTRTHRHILSIYR